MLLLGTVLMTLVTATPPSELSNLHSVTRVILALKIEHGRTPAPDEMAAMFRSALHGLAAEPRRMVRVDEPTPGHFVVRANGKTQELETDDLDWLWRLSFRLKDVAAFVDSALGVKTCARGAQLEQAMVDGLLQHFGPRSRFLPAPRLPARPDSPAAVLARLPTRDVEPVRAEPLCEDGRVVGRFENLDGAVLELPMKRTCRKE